MVPTAKAYSVECSLLANLAYCYGLASELDRLALEFVRKVTSLHLTPPIVESYLSNVYVVSGESHRQFF